MKPAGQCLLLFGVLTFASSQRVANPVLLLAAPQSSAAHPPDAPPAGQPMPGQPVEYHPKPPHPPEDFQQGPDSAQARRRKVDAAQAQKDAQELTELARDVQGEVGELSKAVLSKDLDRELKQIQKLAKRLRREIAP